MDIDRSHFADTSLRQDQRRASGSVTNRSAVTNGKKLIDGIDGRTAAGRRYRDLVRAFKTEIGGTITEAELGLIRQAAALTLRAEQMQADIVNGKEVNTDEVIRLSGTARRLLETIAEKSKKRPTSKLTIRDRIAQRDAGDAA